YRRDGNACGVPSHIFLCTVTEAERTGHDWPVAQMVFTICCQSGRRRVPALAIFLERLHRDPVQISTQQIDQLFGVGSSCGCSAPQVPPVCGDFRAWVRRVLFPQLAQILFWPLLFPVFYVERKESR